MRPWIELLPAMVAALSPLRGQVPEPVCGHPALSRLDPAAAVTIRKGVIQAGNPTFLIREHAAGQSLIRVEFYLLHSDAAFEIYAEVAEMDGGRVDSAAVAQLVATFRDWTLPGSVNPERGISCWCANSAFSGARERLVFRRALLSAFSSPHHQMADS